MRWLICLLLDHDFDYAFDYWRELYTHRVCRRCLREWTRDLNTLCWEERLR